MDMHITLNVSYAHAAIIAVSDFMFAILPMSVVRVSHVLVDNIIGKIPTDRASSNGSFHKGFCL